MRIAYSLLLSDHVRAEEADYSDCATFGLVCPACHEAVFKRVRPTAGGETHYYAHYRKNLEDTEGCELRVASLSAQQLEIAEIEARGQNLSVFLVHFQKSLLIQAGKAYSTDPDLLDRTRKLLVRKSLGEGLWIFTSTVLRNLEAFPPERLRRETSQALRFIYPEDSALLHSRRVRSAIDLAEHLTTRQARPSLRFLVAFIFAMIADFAPEMRDDPLSRVIIETARLVYDNADNCKKVRPSLPRPTTEYMRLRQPNGMDTLQQAIVRQLLSHIFVALGSFPYLELLRKARGTFPEYGEG